MILAPPQQVNNYKSSASQEIIILTRGENIPLVTCPPVQWGQKVMQLQILLSEFWFLISCLTLFLNNFCLFFLLSLGAFSEFHICLSCYCPSTRSGAGRTNYTQFLDATESLALTFFLCWHVLEYSNFLNWILEFLSRFQSQRGYCRIFEPCGLVIQYVC